MTRLVIQFMLQKVEQTIIIIIIIIIICKWPWLKVRDCHTQFSSLNDRSCMHYPH